MPDKPVHNDPEAPARMLLREILPGDRRKFLARSNDAPSGGGARDLRIRPGDAFAPFMARMFPDTEPVKRKLKSASPAGTARVGTMHWFVTMSDGQVEERSAKVTAWESTDSRKGELRLATVHRYGLAEQLEAISPTLKSHDRPQRVLLLLIQNKNNRIYPQFVTEAYFTDEAWEENVRAFLDRCLRAAKGRSAACGWIDFEDGTSFPPEH